MDFVDEDLRKGRTGTGAIPHLLTTPRIGGDIVFGERGFFARQQRLGGAAITAAGALPLAPSRRFAARSIAPARRTGCSGGSSRAANATAPESARPPRSAAHDRLAPSSGPSRVPDRCGPGISAHAPAFARRCHSV